MNVKEEKICRLCLNVGDNDFQIIDNITKKMFEVLLLKVNLEVSKDPIICKDCAKATKKCFSFKSACVDAKNLIMAFDIKYKDIKDEKDIETVDDNFICLFCSNHISGDNFVLLDTLMNNVTFEMLQAFMPEINVNIMQNQAICTSCRHDLEHYIRFVENCLHVEKNITKYIQIEGTSPSGQVELSKIPRFSCKNILELNYNQMPAIKQEDIDEPKIYNGELIKTEEKLNIKDEGDFNETSCQSPSAMAISQISISCEVNKETSQIVDTKNILETRIFKCEMCSYQAISKRYVKSHMLIHKDITEVKKYKCSICAFETKRKGNLVKHRLIHKDITEVEMHKCTMCTYETKRKQDLKIHSLKHKDVTEVEMYKCSMCVFQAKYKRNLVRHMLIHKDITEVEMHKCSMCTFETKHKNCLNTHMLIHKDITKVEKYKCSMCAFETKHKGNLVKHTLIHKDITEVETYKCTMCSYETKRERDIKIHMLKHKDITEVEMYKCSMCIFQAKYKRSLVRHMLIHRDITAVGNA